VFLLRFDPTPDVGARIGLRSLPDLDPVGQEVAGEGIQGVEDPVYPSLTLLEQRIDFGIQLQL